MHSQDIFDHYESYIAEHIANQLILCILDQY